MIVPVPKVLNRNNFLQAIEVLNDLSAFPFFGTLLGIVREGDIIEGDDDVDIYVDAKHHGVIIEKMAAAGFERPGNKSPNNTPYFLQFKKEFDGIETYVDIYLYESSEENNFLIERWNFMGRYGDPEFHLHIDKSLIFPLKTRQFFGYDVSIPANEEGVCSFLYGPNWSRPISKSQGDYVVRIHDNKPVFIQRNEYAYRLLNECEKLKGEIDALKASAHQFQKVYENFDIQNSVSSEQWDWARRETKILVDGQLQIREEVKSQGDSQALFQEKFEKFSSQNFVLAEDWDRLTHETKALCEGQALIRDEVERLTTGQAALHNSLQYLSQDLNAIRHFQSQVVEEIRQSRESVERLLTLAAADRAVLHKLEFRSAQDRELAIEVLQADVARALKAHRGRFRRRSMRGFMPELQEAARKLTKLGFDSEAYSQAHPDVAAAQFDPAQHYLMVGRAEGRQAVFQ